MIAELAQAIMQKFNGSPELRAALAGGLYFQQAPQSAMSPYGTFLIIGITEEEIAGTADDNLRDIDVQFSYFTDATDGGDTIATLTRLFTEAFDWCELSIDGYKSYKVQRETIGPVLYIDEIWQGTITYTVGMIKE